MIKKILRKIIALVTVIMSMTAFNTIGASASWRQDSNGWWNTEGSSWSVGWKEIDGKYYYFGQDGYMAHDTTIDGYKLDSDGEWIKNNATISVIDKSETSTKENQDSDSYDINVSLKYNIHLDDKVKGTNPNIIKATRQAIFDADCYFARLQHYNGYSVNNDVLIFDVKETDTDTWEVDFYEKKSDEKEYDTIGYSFATITKQKDSSYIGGITHSTTVTSTGETY